MFEAETGGQEDLRDREVETVRRLLALAGRPDQTGVSVVAALKLSRREGNTWNRPVN